MATVTTHMISGQFDIYGTIEGDFDTAESQIEFNTFFAWRPFYIEYTSTGSSISRRNAQKYNSSFQIADIRDNYLDYNMSFEQASEIVNILSNNDLYIVDTAGLSNFSPKNTELFESTNLAMPYGSHLPVEMTDIWARNGADVHYNLVNGIPIDIKAHLPITLFNLLMIGHNKGVFTMSDDLFSYIDENMTPMPTDLSFHWNIYLNTSKEKLVVNNTNSVLIRWSCNAVNKGTPQYLTQNPDYLYRSDNTVIKLKVSQSGNPQQATLHDVTTQLYGDIEFSIQMSDLSRIANVTDFMKTLGELFPFTSDEDIYLYMYAEFEDGTHTQYCVQQIPFNSMTQDTSFLYHKNGSDGSTVTIHYGLPAELEQDLRDVAFDPNDFDDKYTNDTYKDNDSSSDFTSKTDSHNSAIGLLTDTYLVTESQLKEIGRKIWSGEFTSLIDTLNASPIENLISIKSFPWELSNQGAESVEIVLGNVEMGVNGLKLNPNYTPKRTLKRHFTIEKKFPQKLNFLNFAPFTNCYIFLPYVGIKEIDLNKVYGKDCELVMIYDVICGGCQYVLKASGIELQKWSGEIAIDIPITASNRVAQNVSYFTGALSTVAQAMSHNYIGALQTGIQTAMSPFHSTTSGAPSSSLDSFDGQEVYLIIDRPMYDEPSNYGKTHGYPCNLQLELGKLHGFVKCKNVHLDGIPCTDEIRARLKERLEKGVYL